VSMIGLLMNMEQMSMNWQGKLKYSEKTLPSATSSTSNPTWPHLRLI
jgi:hypothetical protein